MNLERLFKHYKGQPVEILTEDGVRYCGIDLDSNNESVEIIDKRSRVIYIPFKHITAVVEPKMKLTRFCADDDCDCDYDYDGNRGGNDNDYDNDDCKRSYK